MKKVQIIAIPLLIIFSAISLYGCTIAADGEQVYFYERPAVGFTAVNEVSTNIDMQKQSRISIEAQDGFIKITPWDRDYLQIIERGKLKGPSTRSSLKALLEKSKYTVDKTDYKITLKKEPDKDLKPFFRRTDDIELMVPETLKTINIEAKSGMISMSGFDDLLTADLTIGKGSIKIENCKANNISTTITDGDLNITGIYGSGSYKCGRGNIKLQDIAGMIELKSVSGDTYIENAEGKLDCDISEGNITVKASRLKPESVIYASYGDIEADLEGLDVSGKYKIMAASGNIRLKMPEKTGWSLLARSTKGHVVNNLNLTSGELRKAPSGEVYGDIGGGGPTINVYVDSGDIDLN